MIEIIPPSIHAIILFGLWIFAARRGGDFPRTLTAIYAAFFAISWGGGYLVSQGLIPLVFQILFAGMAVCKCYDYAYAGRKIKSVNKFCLAMIGFMLTIIYSLFIEIIRQAAPSATLDILINIHNLISDILSLYVMYVLVGIIDGAGDNPIVFLHSKIRAFMYYALAFFAPDMESFHYQQDRKTGNK